MFLRLGHMQVPRDPTTISFFLINHLRKLHITILYAMLRVTSGPTLLYIKKVIFLDKTLDIYTLKASYKSTTTSIKKLLTINLFTFIIFI